MKAPGVRMFGATTWQRACGSNISRHVTSGCLQGPTRAYSIQDSHRLSPCIASMLLTPQSDPHPIPLLVKLPSPSSMFTPPPLLLAHPSPPINTPNSIPCSREQHRLQQPHPQHPCQSFVEFGCLLPGLLSASFPGILCRCC